MLGSALVKEGPPNFHGFRKQNFVSCLCYTSIAGLMWALLWVILQGAGHHAEYHSSTAKEGKAVSCSDR